MTQIADLSVKNGSAVAQVFTAYQPQSGSEPAVWYAKTGITRDTWTTLTASAKRTPNKATKLRFNVTIPLYDALQNRIGSIPGNVEMTIPDIAQPSAIADAQAYLANMLDTTVIKEMILTGSAAI